jgi:phosphoglycerate kinase
MLSIDTYNFTGKRAIIRVDFNVPLNEKFEITDDTRIRAAIPTIKKVLETGSVILMSHLGRPKGKGDKKNSLIHLVPHLSKLLGQEIKFADDCIGESAKTMSKNLKKGEVLLLENVRFYDEEEGKPRLPETATEEEKKAAKAELKPKIKEFTTALASLADCYINDAFGTAHRAHASTTLIADYFPNDKMFGYIMNDEVENIDKVIKNAKKPFTAIIGGAKVSTKITIIDNLLGKVNNLIIGGAMTYTFIKAKGGKVGNSLVEDDKLDLALKVFETAKKNNVKLYFPIDSVNADKFDNEAKISISAIDAVPDGLMGLDIGEKSIALFSEVLEKSATILWNGPVGVFEMSNFENGTKKLAEAIVKATAKGAFSLIGGGDSVAAINKYGLAEKVSYVSTGGGALLEYMEGIELPGIKAIRG